jgi:hypothetical protein
MAAGGATARPEYRSQMAIQLPTILFGLVVG